MAKKTIKFAKNRIAIHNLSGGRFALYVNTTCCRIYSRRGYHKAIEDGRMIIYAFQASGTAFETDFDFGPL